MLSYLIVSIVSGVLFGVLDALFNSLPFARKLNEVYQPIAREKINAMAGLIIDLIYGFIMAGIFVLLYESLPGDAGLVKGLSFGIMAWFFRVIMSAASNWMMFKVSLKTTLYSLGAGLVEMLVLGLIYGGFLEPW